MATIMDLAGNGKGGLFGGGGGISGSTFSDLGGAASDLFSIGAHHAKAAGDLLEASNYDLASGLATQNEKFTETSTAIKQAQLDRSITQTIGGQQADVAGAGFTAGGSALDIMRDTASQGALTKAVGEQQGLITEAGYDEQAKSFQTMSQAAHVAADAENKAADAAGVTGALKGIAAVATLI